MIDSSTAKRIVIISDNEGVAKIIKLTIGHEVEIPTFLLYLPQVSHTHIDTDHCALIILALSSVASEPVVALARASLACYVGQVPLLIISERPFVSDRSTQIHHMDFPFTANQLSLQVHQILRSESASEPASHGS